MGTNGLEPLHQPFEIARHERLNIGISSCGRSALVLADFRADLMRNTDEETGQFFLQDRAHARFVCRIGIGMHECNGHRLDIGLT